MYAFFIPMNVELNVSATFSVRLLPEALTEEPVPDTVHWLFDTVPAELGVTAADNTVPASL
jgi:hypothetical protein